MVKKIQAHRGFSEVYPENTMLAFREAVKAGAGGIEMDIRRTVDHVFVIMHDSTVDRTTNGTGAVEKLRYELDLKSLDAGAWKEARFANRGDTKMPTLAQVLDEFSQTHVDLILQLKLEVEDSLDVLSLVQARDMLHRVVFFGQPHVINRIKAIEPQALTQNDGMPGPDDYTDFLENAVRCNHDAVSVSPDVTKEMVAEIKLHHKKVHCSFLTSDYEMHVRRLLDLGVDFILGNNPLEMVSAISNNSVDSGSWMNLGNPTNKINLANEKKGGRT